MVNIGYIRVSLNKQTLEHQRFEINHFAQNEHLKIDMWVEEKISEKFFRKNEKKNDIKKSSFPTIFLT